MKKLMKLVTIVVCMTVMLCGCGEKARIRAEVEAKMEEKNNSTATNASEEDMNYSVAKTKEGLELSQVIPFYDNPYKASFTYDWEQVPQADTQFDLQCKNGDFSANFFCFTGDYVDENETTQDLFNRQNEQIVSKRENVSVINEVSTRNVDEKTIFDYSFRGTHDGVERIYYTSFVDFGDQSKGYVWVLFIISKDELDSYLDELQGIVESISYCETKE